MNPTREYRSNRRGHKNSVDSIAGLEPQQRLNEYVSTTHKHQPKLGIDTAFVLYHTFAVFARGIRDFCRFIDM